MRSIFRCVSVVLLFAATAAVSMRAVGESGDVSTASPSGSSRALIDQVHSAFGLHAGDIVSLRVDTTPGISQRVAVPFDGATLALDLSPHSVRSERYEVRYQQADGSYVTAEPGPIRTVRGTVVGEAGSVVAGSVMQDGLTAVIVMPDEARVWIEPIASRVAGAGAGAHVVYGDRDVIPSGGTCAAEVNAIATNQGEPPQEGSGCTTDICVTELACDSDVEYFQDWGEGVEGRINLVTNTMNLEYERDVGITHAITAIIVRPQEPDPYSSNNNNGLLSQFQSHWQQNQQDIERDVAELFTGRDIDGSVIGTALTIGGICTSQAFCFVQSDCCGSFACATDLSAHELGHLWNGFHCDCPGWTMHTPLQCANQFHEDFSVPGIIFHRNTRSCLSDTAPVTTFPFADSFVDANLDPALWLAEGAVVDGLGDGEPSPPFSLHLNGDDRPTTALMDATTVDQVAVEYWWQRTGTAGGSPSPGEDLVLEYHAAGAGWLEADRQLGDGPDDLPYEHACVTLPNNGVHQALQLRFRINGAESFDHFFVDDVQVRDGASVLSIATQPEFDCACQGGAAEFSIVAAGEPPFQYQWKLDGAPIPGATEATLSLTPDGPEDFGFYSVEITNLCDTIESETAELLEDTPVQIIVPPQDAALPIGDTLALTLVSTGGCNAFQWFVNGAPIADAVSPFLFIPDMQCENQGCYHVEVGNDCGVVASDVAEVVVETCGPIDCDLDVTSPVILHSEGMPGQTRPFTGYVDPRAESTNGLDVDLGITEMQILFSEPVENVGGDALSIDAFVVTQTGPIPPPDVVAVDVEGMPLVSLTLDRPITLMEWTTIRAVVQDQADSANVMLDAGNQGPGVNESDRIDLGFLPANIDQNNSVNPLDLLRFKQYVNGVQEPPLGTLDLFLDINRSGTVNPLDLLAFKRLINGVSPSTRSWAGEAMNSAQP